MVYQDPGKVPSTYGQPEPDTYRCEVCGVFAGWSKDLAEPQWWSWRPIVLVGLPESAEPVVHCWGCLREADADGCSETNQRLPD